jgi:hypothetical protein
MRPGILTLALFLSLLPLLPAADWALTLPDLQGTERQPLAVQESGTILFFITHDCPISNAYSPEIQRLQKEFSAKGFTCALVYVDPDAETDVLKKHQLEFGLAALTAFHDLRHRLVNATGATITPEAVVIDSGGAVAYRGRINNLYADFGKRRRRATKTELRDALQAMLADTVIKTPRSPAIGCYIPKLRIPKTDDTPR